MPQDPTAIAHQLRIHGLVQGVYYRQSMIEAAQRLGLQGWVRNRLDGSVEALAVGQPDAVQALTAWAARGPAAARVQRVEVQEADAALLHGLPAGFGRRDTA